MTLTRSEIEQSKKRLLDEGFTEDRVAVRVHDELLRMRDLNEKLAGALETVLPTLEYAMKPTVLLGSRENIAKVKSAIHNYREAMGEPK